MEVPKPHKLPLNTSEAPLTTSIMDFETQAWESAAAPADVHVHVQSKSLRSPDPNPASDSEDTLEGEEDEIPAASQSLILELRGDPKPHSNLKSQEVNDDVGVDTDEEGSVEIALSQDPIDQDRLIVREDDSRRVNNASNFYAGMAETETEPEDILHQSLTQPYLSPTIHTSVSTPASAAPAPAPAPAVTATPLRPPLANHSLFDAAAAAPSSRSPVVDVAAPLASSSPLKTSMASSTQEYVANGGGENNAEVGSVLDKGGGKGKDNTATPMRDNDDGTADENASVRSDCTMVESDSELGQVSAIMPSEFYLDEQEEGDGEGSKRRIGQEEEDEDEEDPPEATKRSPPSSRSQAASTATASTIAAQTPSLLQHVHATQAATQFDDTSSPLPLPSPAPSSSLAPSPHPVASPYSTSSVVAGTAVLVDAAVTAVSTPADRAREIPCAAPSPPTPATAAVEVSVSVAEAEAEAEVLLRDSPLPSQLPLPPSVNVVTGFPSRASTSTSPPAAVATEGVGRSGAGGGGGFEADGEQVGGGEKVEDGDGNGGEGKAIEADVSTRDAKRGKAARGKGKGKGKGEAEAEVRVEEGKTGEKRRRSDPPLPAIDTKVDDGGDTVEHRTDADAGAGAAPRKRGGSRAAPPSSESTSVVQVKAKDEPELDALPWNAKEEEKEAEEVKEGEEEREEEMDPELRIAFSGIEKESALVSKLNLLLGKAAARNKLYAGPTSAICCADGVQGVVTATHLVLEDASTLKRTAKLLVALNSGVREVVSLDWLVKTAAAGSAGSPTAAASGSSPGMRARTSTAAASGRARIRKNPNQSGDVTSSESSSLQNLPKDSSGLSGTDASIADSETKGPVGDFAVCDANKEALWGFSLQSVLAMRRGPRWRDAEGGFGVLRRCSVCVLPGICGVSAPPEEEFRLIVSSAGGHWLDFQSLPTAAKMTPTWFQKQADDAEVECRAVADSRQNQRLEQGRKHAFLVISQPNLMNVAKPLHATAAVKKLLAGPGAGGIWAVETLLLACLRQRLDLEDGLLWRSEAAAAHAVADSSSSTVEKLQVEPPVEPVVSAVSAADEDKVESYPKRRKTKGKSSEENKVLDNSAPAPPPTPAPAPAPIPAPAPAPVASKRRGRVGANAEREQIQNEEPAQEAEASTSSESVAKKRRTGKK